METQAQLHRKRSYLRFRQAVARNGLGTIGRFLPNATKRRLVRKSPKWGYLYYSSPKLVMHDYWDDLSFNIDARINTEREMLSGQYEGELRFILTKLVKEGFVCLDVGANIGAITLPLCKLVGKSGHVHCFEPGPNFLVKLRANLNLNPQLTSRATLHPVGLSNSPGTGTWQEDPQFPGNAWLMGTTGLDVPLSTLDEFTSKNQISKIDFIKIDVEGMEIEVLQGGLGTINTLRPMILFESSMEFESIRERKVRLEVETLLHKTNYTIYSVTGHGLIPASYPNFTQNSLAIPNDRPLSLPIAEIKPTRE